MKICVRIEFLRLRKRVGDQKWTLEEAKSLKVGRYSEDAGYDEMKKFLMAVGGKLTGYMGYM